MIIETYQSAIVLRILKSGKVYRAHRNLRNDLAYSSLVDLLGLHCKCPIFGCLRYHKKCADGRVSSSVKLILKVPDQYVKLTEYSTWADFMYFVRQTQPNNYKKLASDRTEISQHRFNHIMRMLQNQRPAREYHVPQAILEEIRPEWLVRYHTVHYTGFTAPLRRFFARFVR